MSESASMVERLEARDAERRGRLLAEYRVLLDPGNADAGVVERMDKVARELDKNYDDICSDVDVLRRAKQLAGAAARGPEAATALREAFRNVTEARKQTQKARDAYRLARRGHIGAQNRHGRASQAAADLAALKTGHPDLFAPEPLKHGPRRVRLNPVTSAAPARARHYRI